jgi:hypothetical protein
MRRIGSIIALFLALAAVFSLGVVAGADAKKKGRAKVRKSSQVTLQAVGPDGLAGRVSGTEKACRAQRQVSVYRVNSTAAIPSAEFVAATWTHGDGSWSVPGPMYPSEFFAVIATKKAKRLVCSSASSNHLVWG